MPKRKTKFHKIIIHPNRYLIWALVSALFVAIGLVAYIYIGNVNQDTDLTISPDVTFWHTYKDAALTFRYPGEWFVDPGEGYIGFGPKDRDVFLVYSYTGADAAYSSYLNSDNVEPIIIDGKDGIRVRDSFATNEHIAFVKNLGKLYEFRGSTGAFDKILSTVRFSN